MSLRSKVIGTLMSVLALYAFAAWFALDNVYTSAFNNLEQDNVYDHLARTSQFIESERVDVDLIVKDWAVWNESMKFVLGRDGSFKEDNLDHAYLHELGMSYGAFFDSEHRLIWSEAYTADGSIEPIDSLISEEVLKASINLTPQESGELLSGFIQTEKGPAFISSAAVHWSFQESSPGGYMIMGKVLDQNRLQVLSDTMLTQFDILPTTFGQQDASFTASITRLLSRPGSQQLLRNHDTIFGLSLIQDITGQDLGIIRVSIPAEISRLGGSALRSSITMILIAALVLMLTLWIALKSLMVTPIENLIAVLRGDPEATMAKINSTDMLSTVRRLTDSRGVLSTRNDEIGQLYEAFDELGSALRDASTAVWRLAHIDGLTGLACRSLLLERLAKSLSDTSMNNSISLMFIDLDDFKLINDQHGHETGDRLLIEVANRLRAVVGIDNQDINPEDENCQNLVARFGGDEFVVMLISGSDSRPDVDIAAAIVEEISSPFFINGIECRVGACVGLSRYPSDANDVNSLLSAADEAMYAAKSAGKSCWRRFERPAEWHSTKKSA